MELSETFYAIGSVTLIAITALLAFLVYEVYLTLKALQAAMTQANNIAGNLKSVTTGMQFGFWALITKLLGTVTKGGGR
jgi:uncharacterized membrane protein (DUF485 family)